MSGPSLYVFVAALVMGALSAACSLAAMLGYLKEHGAQALFGFGFSRYYWGGGLRRDQPRIFWGSLGGALSAMALLILAGALAR